MNKKLIFLLCVLIITSLIVACSGAYLKYSLFVSLGLETEENIISLPFVLMTDDQLAYSVSRRMKLQQNPTEPPEEIGTQPPVTETEAPADEPMEETAVPETVSPETEAPTSPPETEPVYVQVDESWFDDALFIGDSRTVGLKAQARLGTADYFCDVNLTVYGVLSLATQDKDYYTQTLVGLLDRVSYEKIFIGFGINECAGDLDDFAAMYAELITIIRNHQPDAYIILQSVMPVSRDYAVKPEFQPESLARFSEAIQNLADDEKVFYLDVNYRMVDEDGYLRDDLTNDGCHPHAEGYGLWAQWIMEEVGWFNIP